MYRRYEPAQKNGTGFDKRISPADMASVRANQNNKGRPKMGCAQKVNPQKSDGNTNSKTKVEDKTKKIHPLMKLIPQSIYNPENGKVLGIMSAEDLLIIALIILMLDSGDEREDNNMLIYALIYILVSEYIELPF